MLSANFIHNDRSNRHAFTYSVGAATNLNGDKEDFQQATLAHRDVVLRDGNRKPVRCVYVISELIDVVDKFVGNQEEKQHLHNQYGADICEMESAAVLLTCLRSGVPCLMIKAVSDGLTGGGEEFYEALQSCAALCLEVTDQIIREL